MKCVFEWQMQQLKQQKNKYRNNFQIKKTEKEKKGETAKSYKFLVVEEKSVSSGNSF